jgi:glycosyltransferase involved in cell wall biosynthesis
MNIVQINTDEIIGGATLVARGLFTSYRQLGHNSWFLVNSKQTADPDVIKISNNRHRNQWARYWLSIGEKICKGEGEIFDKWRRRIGWIGQPKRFFEIQLGHEDWNFPGTNKLLDLIPQRPDIIHCHNLHGGYFDLGVLPKISRRFPVLITLHDAWLLSGNCAHSFECQRWKTGCGHCPDISIYPGIVRDATAANWSRKKSVFQNSRLYISTPSKWLMNRVRQSILEPSIIDHKIIPNGIDLSTFHREKKSHARQELGLPTEALVMLCSANNIKHNEFKDYQTLINAIKRVLGTSSHPNILVIVMGDNSPEEHYGNSVTRFIPYAKDQSLVARYYQASDIFLHAAKVDNFPNTILEALACGIPVVATAVGGIPEQIIDSETGFLVPKGDFEMLAARIEQLVDNEEIRNRMGDRAEEDAQMRFGLERQVKDYLDWYHEILQKWGLSRSQKSF